VKGREVEAMSEELLPPSMADVSRRNEHVHRVRGVNGGGARTEVSVRSFSLAMDEPELRVKQLVRNVEARCPVANLLRAAEVALAIDWRARPAAEAAAD